MEQPVFDIYIHKHHVSHVDTCTVETLLSRAQSEVSCWDPYSASASCGLSGAVDHNV